MHNYLAFLSMFYGAASSPKHDDHKLRMNNDPWNKSTTLSDSNIMPQILTAILQSRILIFAIIFKSFAETSHRHVNLKISSFSRAIELGTTIHNIYMHIVNSCEHAQNCFEPSVSNGH